MSNILRIIGVISIILASVAPAAPANCQTAQPVSQRLPKQPADIGASQVDPHLSSPTVVIPVTLVNGYPFIDGSIAGHSGKLLFDLGSAKTLTVNSDAISVPNAVSAGPGFFGSGQTHTVVRYPVVSSLVLPGNQRFEAIENIAGNGGRQLQSNITPDFIGWLGTAFFRGYAAKISYGPRPMVKFYASGLSAALRGEAVIQRLSLGNPEHPNLAVFPITVGGRRADAAFDTGANNVAWLSRSERDALEKSGALRKKRNDQWVVRNVSIDGFRLPDMPIEIVDGPPPFFKIIPHPHTPYMTLGYEFLLRFDVALDLDQHQATLIERH